MTRKRSILSLITANVGGMALPECSSTRAGLSPVPDEGRPSTCPVCGGQVRNNKPRGRYECKLSACGWTQQYKAKKEAMQFGPSSSKIGMAWSRQDELSGVYKNFKCPDCGCAVRYQRQATSHGAIIIACSNPNCSWTIDEMRRS